jgi:hypothetical protein
MENQREWQSREGKLETWEDENFDSTKRIFKNSNGIEGTHCLIPMYHRSTEMTSLLD